MCALRGENDRVEFEKRLSAWLAWHNAVLPNMEELPSIDELVGAKARETEAQDAASDERLLFDVRQLKSFLSSKMQH